MQRIRSPVQSALAQALPTPSESPIPLYVAVGHGSSTVMIVARDGTEIDASNGNAIVGRI